MTAIFQLAVHQTGKRAGEKKTTVRPDLLNSERFS